MAKRKFIGIVLVGIILAGCSHSGDNENPIPDLAAAPSAVTWQSVSGIQTPVDSTDGPASTDPVPHGWAHTPQGAVMAAFNAQVMMATANDQLWPQVSQYQLAAGPGRDQWAQGRALLSVSGSVADPAVFKAFRVVEYADEKAQVVLAAEYPDVGLTLYPVQLAWSGDDWKVVLPTVDAAPDLTPVTALDDGFTTFSAKEGN
jgi:hypothetical protein